MVNWLKNLWQKNPKAVVVGVSVQLTILIVIALSWVIMSKPRLISTTIVAGQKVSLVSPVRFSFSVPISRRSFDGIIKPEIDGSWDWGDSAVSHLQRQVSFTPDEAWQPDQKYTVSLVTSNILGSKTETTAATFQTVSVPNIASTSVTDGKDISPIDPIKVALSETNDSAVNFSFVLDPPAALDSELSDDGLTYTLTPKEPLKSGVSYNLTITRQLMFQPSGGAAAISRAQVEDVFTTTFVTKPPAGLASFSPQGNAVLPTATVIDMNFKDVMDRSSVEVNTTFSPTLAGSWQWVSDTQVKYNLAKALDFDTTYHVTFGSDVAAKSGVTFSQDTVMTFKTVGNLKVTKVSPSNRSTGILRNTSISLTFDQPPDQASVESSFSFGPNINGTFSWRGQILTFTPATALEYSTAYTINLSTDAKSALGKPLGSPFSAVFTTEEKTVLLNIASYHQRRALSCEAATLKMALGYRGVTVSEDDIMAIVGYDPTIRGGGVWGDPNSAFVGDINGSQNTTGYGVYWGPIASAAKVWRQNIAFSGWSLSQLAAELDAGNPVIVWGTIGSAVTDSWQTPGGQTVNAWKGEHTRLVVGYRGNANNPTSFILNDPIAGRVSWSAAKFQSNWSSFNSSGVVIK